MDACAAMSLLHAKFLYVGSHNSVVLIGFLSAPGERGREGGREGEEECCLNRIF